ncbi:MAG: tetratricopeptide repeat protein [Anaerolineae bacterium]|nr:tetratricopeptide repeat protein [Anaerolineae bacterium]
MNLQERYDQLVQEEFVGREAEVEQFLHNLSLPLSSSEHRYIFNVYGPKGVGKSTLLRRYRFLAQEEMNVPVVSAWINENINGVLDVLERIAAPFSLPQFQEHMRFYQRQVAVLKASEPIRRQTVDLSQPTDLHRKIGQYFSADELQALCLDLGVDYDDLEGGTRQAKATSLVGYCNRRDLRASLIARCAELRPHVDWRDVAMVTDMRRDLDEGALWEAHVRRHVENEEEVRLLLHPVESLTLFLLADLEQALGDDTFLILFVDGFEEKRSYLEPWFCGLLNGRFGAVPDNIIIVLAGDNPLTDSCWDNYQQIISQQHLEPFTEAEARDFLVAKEVDDPQQIDQILRTVKMAGRNRYLMLDLATAVASGGILAAGSSRKAHSAVTLFLATIEEKHYQSVVLRAALPRRLDADILELLLDQDEVEAESVWLMHWPFVKASGTDTWTYHDNMRDDILAYSRHAANGSWSELQERLVAYHHGYRAKVRHHVADAWHDAAWQKATLEIIYHRLCQSRSSRRRHVSPTLGNFLFALQADQQFAQQWADTIEQAGKDCGSRHIQEWGRFLGDGVEAYVAGDYGETAVMLTRLIDRKTLEDRHRVIALRWRGDSYRHLRYDQKAIADYNQAIRLDPNYAWAYAGRGETYRWLEQYEQAIADFDRAIELEPEFVWALAHRGEMYRKLEENEKALADFNKAIELDPNLAWVIASRGELYRTMEQYTYALADLDQAIELNPTYAWAIASRGQTYRKLGQFEEALKDFETAVQINPDYYWAIAGRAQTRRKLEQYDEAVNDFTLAVELNPGYAWAVAERGKTYRQMGEYDKALVDFDQAVEIDPTYDWALAGRGETYRLMGEKEKALADFNKVLKNNPNDAWTRRRRERVLKNGRS